MLPDWPKASTPTGTVRAPKTLPSQARWWLAASWTVTIGSARSAGCRSRAQVVVVGRRRSPGGLRRAARRATPGRGGRDWSGRARAPATPSSSSWSAAASTSGTTGAARGEHDRRRSRPARAAGSRRRATSARSVLGADAVERRGERALVDRPGRQAEVQSTRRRASPSGASPSHSSQSSGCGVSTARRSVRPGSSSPIDGVIVALVGAALRRERDAGRRADDDEPGAVVEGVDRARRGRGRRTGRRRCRSGGGARRAARGRARARAAAGTGSSR